MGRRAVRSPGYGRWSWAGQTLLPETRAARAAIDAARASAGGRLRCHGRAKTHLAYDLRDQLECLLTLPDIRDLRRLG
jgi:hypothetical protein